MRSFGAIRIPRCCPTGELKAALQRAMRKMRAVQKGATTCPLNRNWREPNGWRWNGVVSRNSDARTRALITDLVAPFGFDTRDSLSSLGDLDQVIAKLSLNGTVDGLSLIHI